MAYQTYTTEALVCGTFDRNTADRSYLLFTREAGMLYADARSAREERSRQRYALQDFSRVRVSLVKGKGGWKVGSIEPLENFYQQAVDKEARGSVVSIFRFLRRFVGSEESAPELFDHLIAGLSQVHQTLPERHFVVLALRVLWLAELGYVDAKRVPPAVRTAPVAELSQHATTLNVQAVEQLFDQAVSVSHL